VNEVTFTYTSYNEDTEEYLGEVTHSFRTEGYLPEMLYNFKAFLQGAGFNYVSEVYATKNDGQEVGEE